MKKWLIALCCILIAGVVAFVTFMSNSNSRLDALNRDLGEVQAENNSLKEKAGQDSKRMLRAPGRQFFSDNPLTHHRTIRRLFSDKVQFRYLPRCSRRFLNLSTRPPESTNFCLPVKKGWHLEQMSTRSSPLASPFVERVVTVSPHAQRIVTSLY